MAKTIFFQSLDIEAEEGKTFRKGLDVIARLSQPVLARLAGDLPDLIFLRLKSQTEDFIIKQVADLKISFVDAQYAVNGVIRPILDWFRNQKGKADTPELMVDDMLEQKLLGPAEGRKLLSVLQLLKNTVAPKVDELDQLRDSSTGVFPSFTSIGTTVEMRAVFNPNFRLGQSLATYNPTPKTMVAVASIMLSANRGDGSEGRTRFFFQCDEEELGWLIEKLQATKLEMRALLQATSAKPIDSQLKSKARSSARRNTSK